MYRVNSRLSALWIIRECKFQFLKNIAKKEIILLTINDKLKLIYPELDPGLEYVTDDEIAEETLGILKRGMKKMITKQKKSKPLHSFSLR